jgi:hypothetical protein
MKPQSKIIALIVLGFLLPSLTSFSFAQTSDPAWLDTLNFEMEREQECEVAYYIRIKEGMLGTKKTYEARVQCVDGRQFDASRVGEVDDFEIKACEVETC